MRRSMEFDGNCCKCHKHGQKAADCDDHQQGGDSHEESVTSRSKVVAGLAKGSDFE